LLEKPPISIYFYQIFLLILVRIKKKKGVGEDQ